MKMPDETRAAVAPNGSGFRFGIIVSTYNGQITGPLADHCVRTLLDHGVDQSGIDLVRVPGAFELPVTAMTMARTKRYNALIALGCVLRGETPHNQYISQEAARGLGQVALETGVPVAFGVLTPNTIAQARARSSEDPQNKGREAAIAALKMAELMKRLKTRGGK